MNDGAARLDDVKRLVREGKFEIGNDAVSAGPEAVVVKMLDDGGLYIEWQRRGVGFGTLTLRAEQGKLVADTECMSDAFVLDVLAQALRERNEIG